MSKRTIKLERQYRAASIESGSIDQENMTVDLSFSSEEPVKRWFGHEILSHKKEDVNLDRLNDSAAVLVNHNGDQVGVVEKAMIKSKKGLAKLRFSPNTDYAKAVFQDIVDGIRKNVSVGYDIIEFQLDREDENGVATYRAQWEPLEISMVGVPADKTVGVGRSHETREVEVPEGFPEKETEKETEEDKIENARKLSVKDGKLMRGEDEIGDAKELISMIAGGLIGSEKGTELRSVLGGLIEIIDGSEGNREEIEENEQKSAELNRKLQIKRLSLEKLKM